MTYGKVTKIIPNPRAFLLISATCSHAFGLKPQSMKAIVEAIASLASNGTGSCPQKFKPARRDYNGTFDNY